MISTLLFTISIPNLMKATSEDVQWLKIHLTFSHLIEQSIHIQIDWKLCRECNNLINLCLLFFNIQQFKSLMQDDFFNWPPLVWDQNDEKPTSQPTHLIHSLIYLKLCRECNIQINLWLPSFNICNDERWLWLWWKNEQTKEWLYQWTNELTNEWINQQEKGLSQRTIFFEGGEVFLFASYF